MSSHMVPDLVGDAYVPVVDDHGVLLLVPEEESVPESTPHAREVSRIAAGLNARFADRPDVAVHDRLAWFPDRDDTRIRSDPDVMVVIGRPKADRSSYRAWAEEGVAPTVVIEVVSDGDSRSDYQRRLARARTYGVAEVVLIDPFHPAGGTSVTHLLADPDRPDSYRAVASSAAPEEPIDIPTLGITLAGGPTLVVADEHGVWPDTTQALIDARTQRTRAMEADARAQDVEAQLAEERAARQRLDALLRAHGIDPDQP